MPKKKFTETGVKRIRPDPSGKRLEFTDTIVPNLALRITASGTKSFSSVFRILGKQRRYHIGDFPTFSVQQARTIARETRQDVALGIDPIAKRKAKIRAQQKESEEGITVKGLSEQYIERDCKPKNRTWKGTQQTFDKHILPALGDMRVDELKRKHVIKLLEKITRSKHPHAANHVLTAIKRMYNWAIEVDELEYNPCNQIKKPLRTTRRDRYFNDEECKAFWLTCEEKIDYPYGPLLQLLLLLGQRRGEISKLQWNHIDFNEKLIRFPAENVKNKKNHEIPLPDMAIEIIQRLPRFKNGKYVFTTSHGKRPVDGFGKVKSSIQEHFHAEDWRYHDLRRSCATGLARLGVRRDTLRHILNHSDNSVTAIYDRYGYMAEKRHALNLWARHLQNLIDGSNNSDSNIITLESNNA